MYRTITTLIILLMLSSASQVASAALIVTKAGDDSVLEAVFGFDAGPLGIVDMDFGGTSFNDAFGTDATPPGYLFPTTNPQAAAILTDIATLLNLHNASAVTDITSVMDSVIGTSEPNTAYLDVAYAVTPTTIGFLQISYGNSSWSLLGGLPSFDRDSEFLNLARMTASAVPEPATLALFGIGLAGLGFARKKKKSV